MFEHLILLIGTNPLPNLVVAEYFLKNNADLKKVYLVYSEKTNLQDGTYTYAENLETVLKNRYTSKPIFPLNKIAISDVSNSKQILNDIKSKLVDGIPSNSSVHLNYTGGTKVMGNHVYRAIESDDSKNLKKSFSYLDGRNFRLIDDEHGIISDDLRLIISIKFKELIELHGYERKNEDSVDFLEAIQIFSNLIKDDRLNDYFKNYNRSLFEAEHGRLAEKTKDLKNELRSCKPEEPLFSVIKAMPEEYRLFDENKNFKEPASSHYVKKAIKFLDGGWLEDYIYGILISKFSSSNYEILKNWKIKRDGWDNNFELDVILLKGYQLIGISCTTSHEKYISKSKGFEIIHRVRQIGGDEAKAVLITRVNDNTKKDLQEELEIDTGGTTANILVLGSSDLKENRLIAKIADFVKED